jgi:hypothetical protein
MYRERCGPIHFITSQLPLLAQLLLQFLKADGRLSSTLFSDQTIDHVLDLIAALVQLSHVDLQVAFVAGLVLYDGNALHGFSGYLQR